MIKKYILKLSYSDNYLVERYLPDALTKHRHNISYTTNRDRAMRFFDKGDLLNIKDACEKETGLIFVIEEY